MEKTELLALAREYATTEDLFDLLGIDALDAEDEAQVRRAWRKASLKYHPDKVGGPSGAGFDDKMKAKWELLERAREILSDPKTREVYVSARRAAKLQEEKKAAMNAKQREMIERLEAAEKAGREAKNPQAPAPKPPKTEAEKEAERQATARGRAILENRRRLMREALERERIAKEEEDRRLAEKEAELEQRLEESRQRKEAKRARRAAKEAHRARNATSTTPSTDEQANAVPPGTTSAGATPSSPTRARQGPSPHPKMDALLARLRREKAERDKQEKEQQERDQQGDK